VAELAAVQFGIKYKYHDRWSCRDCYVVNCDCEDGASLIVELYNEDSSDISGELRRTEACALTLIGGAA
jgi:hypothetical protein